MTSRLGYINLDKINRLANDGLSRELTIETLPVCESCVGEKINKIPFLSKC